LTPRTAAEQKIAHQCHIVSRKQTCFNGCARQFFDGACSGGAARRGARHARHARALSLSIAAHHLADGPHFAAPEPLPHHRLDAPRGPKLHSTAALDDARTSARRSSPVPRPRASTHTGPGARARRARATRCRAGNATGGACPPRQRRAALLKPACRDPPVIAQADAHQGEDNSRRAAIMDRALALLLDEEGLGRGRLGEAELRRGLGSLGCRARWNRERRQESQQRGPHPEESDRPPWRDLSLYQFAAQYAGSSAGGAVGVSAGFSVTEPVTSSSEYTRAPAPIPS